MAEHGSFGVDVVHANNFFRRTFCKVPQVIASGFAEILADGNRIDRIEDATLLRVEIGTVILAGLAEHVGASDRDLPEGRQRKGNARKGGKEDFHDLVRCRLFHRMFVVCAAVGIFHRHRLFV